VYVNYPLDTEYPKKNERKKSDQSLEIINPFSDLSLSPSVSPDLLLPRCEPLLFSSGEDSELAEILSAMAAANAPILMKEALTVLSLSLSLLPCCLGFAIKLNSMLFNNSFHL